MFTSYLFSFTLQRHCFLQNWTNYLPVSSFYMYNKNVPTLSEYFFILEFSGLRSYMSDTSLLKVHYPYRQRYGILHTISGMDSLESFKV